MASPTMPLSLVFVVVGADRDHVLVENNRNKALAQRSRDMLPEGLKIGDQLALQPDGTFRLIESWLPVMLTDLARSILRAAQASLANALDCDQDAARHAMLVWCAGG